MRFGPALLALAITGCQGPTTAALPEDPPAPGDPVVRLQVAPLGADHVLVGQSRQLEVTAWRRSGLASPFDGPVSFRSTSPSSLAVDSTGLVRAVGSGAGHVVVVAEVGRRFLVDSVRLVAVDPGFTVELTPRPVAVFLGTSIQVRLVARTPDGDSLPAPLPRYRSTDTTTLPVDSTGRISAVALGRGALIIGEVPTPYGLLADTLPLWVVCTAELTGEYESPPDPFRVGMSFPLRLRLYTCSKQLVVEDEITWSSSDSSVVAIDANNERATARGAGTAIVRATGRRHRWTLVHLPVTVVP